MFNLKIKIMKKSLLLLGTALVVSTAGFAQNAAKKAINPKYLQKTSVVAMGKVLVEPQPTTIKNNTANSAKKGHQSTSSACTTTQSAITTSWNCIGVGGGSNTSTQNCLSYNQDLNTLAWIQRGSKTWPMVTTSGFLQATIINATTLAKDSVILYNDATTRHARYPGGVLLNPASNTVTATMSYTNALAIGIGVATDNTNWTGTPYVAKPLWSKSALTHTLPSGDSLYTPAVGGFLGNNTYLLQYEGTPSTDIQALSDRKTIVSIGNIGDHAFTASNNNTIYKGVFVKGVLNGAGNSVTWTADTTSLVPAAHKGTLGYQLSAPRLAFGPDGLHGYALFLGRLSTAYGNASADSAMTPILYATTDGGTTWAQKLAGFDWMCLHPEVEKNVGELVGNKRFYTFDEYLHGADVTVDANNVLHFVTCVDQSTSLPGPGGITTIDSLGIYSPTYQYDYVYHHPIIWDFMTDGSDWKTMMVDSIISAACGKASTDTTSIHSAMGGASILGVSSHITVSRSKDGTKIFYGWADSDPNVTLQVYNINPDILMKAYDITSGMVSATKNATNGIGTCFYPFLSDISYNDGTNWVVPAVYTVGHGPAIATQPQTTYDASSQADYYFTNCGTFNPTTEFTVTPVINPSLWAQCFGGIKQSNTFESSISNYPNPFNNFTTISVTLSESKNIDVKVYNTIGSLVFNKKVTGNVGENAISFDGSALSSGVYYYTVTSGNQQATKKMIVQK
jgi:hypothetical protein